MEDYPRTMLELEERFKKEAACWDYLSSLKSLVLIAAQKDGKHIGRIRLVVIPNASADSIDQVLEHIVEPGALVQADGWARYSRLEKRVRARGHPARRSAWRQLVALLSSCRQYPEAMTSCYISRCCQSWEPGLLSG